MVLYKIYSQEHRIRYFAHPCSTAVLFQICCLLLTFLPPLFTSYFTGGFYYKELAYTEQPNVTFSGKYDVIISSLSSVFFSSSEAPLNNYYITNYQNVYYPTVLRTGIPRDVDGDGITDQQTITMTVILPSNIQGSTINVWLIFQYALNQYPLVNMETLGVISLKTPATLLANTTVSVYGQLRFQQQIPVLSDNNDSTIAGPIIDYGNFSLPPSFDDLLSNYRSRNYYTTFDQQYVQWSSAAATDTSILLTVKVVVNTGPQSILYVPIFWKEFRWTWIQYITALLPFFYLANKVKEFVFSNGLVRTVVRKSA